MAVAESLKEVVAYLWLALIRKQHRNIVCDLCNVEQ